MGQFICIRQFLSVNSRISTRDAESNSALLTELGIELELVFKKMQELGIELELA